MYSDDSFLKAQQRMMAMQKIILKKKRDEARPVPDVRPQATPTQDISIFESLDRLENDIELSKKELDEYLGRHGNDRTPIPNLHQISPLSRQILSELKKVNFSDVSENQLRELHTMSRKITKAWNELFPSILALYNLRRQKDKGYRKLYQIAKTDFNNTIDYIKSRLSNVSGHNYLSGSGIPKRFL